MKDNNKNGKTNGDRQDKPKFKPGNKNGRRDIEILDTLDRMARSKGNPVEYYNKYPQYFKDAGTLAFAHPLGSLVDIRNTDSDPVQGRQFYIPGIMSLHFYPTVGYSADNSSAINRASQSVTTYMKATQKFTSAFDKADVMMAFMALDSCYILYEMGKRAYGAVNITSPTNRWFPNTLVQALGFDYDSLAADPAEFRTKLNKFAIDLGQFCVPKDLDITARHMWMCRGLYWDTDDNQAKAQLYAFVPKGVWKFEKFQTTGSALSWVPLPSIAGGTSDHYMTVDEFFTIAYDLLNAISGDDDIVQICALFFNAFGRESMRQLSEVEDLYTILPTYDKLVLSQIENATCVGNFAASYTPQITQVPTIDNGAIIFKPQFQFGVGVPGSVIAGFNQKRILNWHGAQPSPEDVIEMTRLTICAANDTISGNIFSPTSFGADIVSNFAIWNVPINGLPMASPYPAITIWQSELVLNQGDDTIVHYVSYGKGLCNLMSFDWGPKVSIFAQDKSQDPPVLYYCGSTADMNNYSILENTKLENMHDAAMLSLFAIPQMGFTISK